MGLYSQGTAFSRKVVNRKVLALILNFSTMSHEGGVWGGGVWIILACEPEGSTSILWKRHIFKAVCGAIMGGLNSKMGKNCLGEVVKGAFSSGVETTSSVSKLPSA